MADFEQHLNDVLRWVPNPNTVDPLLSSDTRFLSQNHYSLDWKAKLKELPPKYQRLATDALGRVLRQLKLERPPQNSNTRWTTPVIFAEIRERRVTGLMELPNVGEITARRVWNIVRE